jgi:uncharacterized membrane protein
MKKLLAILSFLPIMAFAENTAYDVKQCSGNEPGWVVEINDNIKFTSNRGDMTKMIFKKSSPKSAHGYDKKFLVLYTGKSIEKPVKNLTLIISKQKCSDHALRDDHEFSSYILIGNDFYSGCCDLN